MIGCQRKMVRCLAFCKVCIFHFPKLTATRSSNKNLLSSNKSLYFRIYMFEETDICRAVPHALVRASCMYINRKVIAFLDVYQAGAAEHILFEGGLN
jgi:hypothetical protein